MGNGAAGGLTVGSGALFGVAGLAARASNNGSLLATRAAALGSATNLGAEIADGLAAANDAHTLYSQWDDLSPAQRAQTALNVAFWGGMTGASVKMNNGSFGDVTFSDNFNRAMIETGAAITHDAELPPGTASIKIDDDNSLSIQHHPNADDYVVRAHQEAAHTLLNNGNVGAAVQRFFGTTDAYPPRSFGEATAVEIAKHEYLIESLDTQLKSGVILKHDEAAAQQTLADYQFELLNHRADLAHIQANPEAGFAAGPEFIEVKRSNAYRVGADAEGLTLTDNAQLPFDSIVSTDLAQQFPDAIRVEYSDLNTELSLTLSDGTTITKTGERGNQLAQILRPIEQGGWGGAVFHDAATDSLVVAVNMRKTGAEDVLDRVEVSFARNDAGEWRVDFSEHAAYTNQIDPGLSKNRPLHFREANKLLSAELATNPELDAKLDFTSRQRAIVDSGTRSSPEPYTWHHVNGDGDMQLVNESIHAFFNHSGGFSEWANN